MCNGVRLQELVFVEEATETIKARIRKLEIDLQATRELETKIFTARDAACSIVPSAPSTCRLYGHAV